MEEMACNILKMFDSKSEDFINRYLLMQKIPYFGISCLKMGKLLIYQTRNFNLINISPKAEEANCLQFWSLSVVQNLTTGNFSDLLKNYMNNNKSFYQKFGMVFQIQEMK